MPAPFLFSFLPPVTKVCCSPPPWPAEKTTRRLLRPNLSFSITTPLLASPPLSGSSLLCLPRIPPETDLKRYNRMSTKTDYRNETNPTSWHRYFTLERYVLDGTSFDKIMDRFYDEPPRAQSRIWYQYMYHIDRNIDIPQVGGKGDAKVSSISCNSLREYAYYWY